LTCVNAPGCDRHHAIRGRREEIALLNELGERLRVGIMPAAQAAVEIVERKGMGHPDSICDALAETASLALCRLYRERFGVILHHNVDKALLVGGQAQPDFGGGRVTRPIEIFLAGRATRHFKGVALPVEECIEEACRTWLREHLAALDVDRHVKLHILLRPTSETLGTLFPSEPGSRGAILANDTSCGVGYAPLTPLEGAVYAVERQLNGRAMKALHREIGEDIKVMGVRSDRGARFTVALAFVGAHLANARDYLLQKSTLCEAARAIAGAAFEGEATVEINTADLPPDRLYLTVTGTSAEAGDDGQAGRGNRVNGLITPHRPMTMESLAGKNPINHVGKLYNLAAALIADELVRDIDAIEAAECYLVSRIGCPIGEPQIIDLRLRLASGASAGDVCPLVREIVIAQLDRLDRLADDLLDGRLGFDRWPLRTPTKSDLAG
jgi:S-adenosylmethionine synthetase